METLRPKAPIANAFPISEVKTIDFLTKLFPARKILAHLFANNRLLGFTLCQTKAKLR